MVIAREPPGDKRLVGYVTSVTGTLDPVGIRAQLSERLPAYMVPVAVVVLEALPLTADGKLDTRALPAPEYAGGADYRAPGSAVEEILAGIYAEVLGVEHVGLDDSFFDLGGDSLSAMRLIAAVNTSLDAILPVRTIFDAPTVAQLASCIREGGPSRLSRLARMERPALVPLSYAQNRLWFLDQLQGPSPVYNLAAGLRLAGRLDVDALSAALADVVGRQESLRTLFVAPDGAPQQVVVPVDQAGIGWDVVDATAWSAPQLEEAAVDAARYTFDLSTEIPLRVTLFRLAEDEHVLVAVLHHIVADGGFDYPAGDGPGCAYASRQCRASPGLGPGAGRAVRRLHAVAARAAGRPGRQREPDRRTACLLGAGAGRVAERLELPTGRPYPPVADHRGASVVVDWPAELQQQIRRAAPRARRDQFHDGAGRPGGAVGQLSASSDVALG